jgi:hypothetical protein
VMPCEGFLFHLVECLLHRTTRVPQVLHAHATMIETRSYQRWGRAPAHTDRAAIPAQLTPLGARAGAETCGRRDETPRGSLYGAERECACALHIAPWMYRWGSREERSGGAEGHLREASDGGPHRRRADERGRRGGGKFVLALLPLALLRALHMPGLLLCLGLGLYGGKPHIRLRPSGPTVGSVTWQQPKPVTSPSRAAASLPHHSPHSTSAPAHPVFTH